jgi:hypothetical protein
MSWLDTNTQLKHQLLLLRCAVADRIDKNPHVSLITYNEILQWVDDLLEMIDK